VKHPHNTFIIVFDALSLTPKLYGGKEIRRLVAGGLKLAPMLQGFSNIKNFLNNL
jgi:hypothetical protein